MTRHFQNYATMRSLTFLPLLLAALLCGGCSISYTDEEVRAGASKTLDQFYTSLINLDGAAFEDCFADREAYVVHGEHIYSIREDYPKFKRRYEQHMAELRDSYTAARASYGKMAIGNGGVAIFYGPIDAKKGRRFWLEPSGGEWKITRIEFVTQDQV